MDYEVQRTASDYAKARVEQIRKKFGYSNTKENKPAKPKQLQQNQFVAKELTTQKNTPVKYLAQKTNKQANACKDSTEYHDRIKNIDVLNRRILQILNTKQNKCLQVDFKKQMKKEQCFVDKKIQARRASVPLLQKSQKANQNLYFNHQHQFSKVLKKAEVKEINGLIDKKTKQSQFKENKKQHLGLYIPNNKYTVSVELPQLKESTQTSKPNNNILETRSLNIVSEKASEKNKKQIQQSTKKESVKLAQKLSQQISKDQNFSFSKWEFSEWKNTDKWQLLKNKLNGSRSVEKIKQIFNLQPEQHNPFYELKEPITSKCLQNLVNNYNQSQLFWGKNLKQSCSIVELEKQFFNIKEMDLNKKGYLSIEDIVCFVNLHTGKFYRNRDAIGLLKRFSDGKQINDGIKYQKFLDKITKG